jgi:Tfp pilus assembly protein FimT
VNIKNKYVAADGDGGFSITELVLIIALVALVAGLSVPMLSNSMRALQLAADGRNIATSLTYAKISAMSQMTWHQLAFDVSGNQWSVQKYNKGTSTFDNQGASVQLGTGIANSGIALQSTSESAPTGFPTTSSSFIRFNSRGIPINAAGIPTANNVIYLEGSGTQFAVTVSLIGKVQLWKLQGGQWNSQ